MPATGRSVLRGVDGEPRKWGVWGQKKGKCRGRRQPIPFRLVYNSHCIYIHPIGAWLMVLAGAYIIFYWLTLGGLL